MDNFRDDKIDKRQNCPHIETSHDNTNSTTQYWLIEGTIL